MGSISLATFQWKQPFPHHMSLKTFVNICCFRRIVLYQMGAGQRLVKWALNSSVLVFWDSLFMLHFFSLFCPWKFEVGKGCGFPAIEGCRADLFGMWCCVPQSEVQPQQDGLLRGCCGLRLWHCFGPNNILAVSLAVHWVTSECHLFPCWVSSGFLNSAGILLRFYSGILKGVQEWEHPNSTKTQGVRYWAPVNAVRLIILRKNNGFLLVLLSQNLCAWMKRYAVKTITPAWKCWPFLSELNNHVCLY